MGLSNSLQEPWDYISFRRITDYRSVSLGLLVSGLDQPRLCRCQEAVYILGPIVIENRILYLSIELYLTTGLSAFIN